jgi:hypothetical protein
VNQNGNILMMILKSVSRLFKNSKVGEKSCKKRTIGPDSREINFKLINARISKKKC